MLKISPTFDFYCFWIEIDFQIYLFKSKLFMYYLDGPCLIINLQASLMSYPFYPKKLRAFCNEISMKLFLFSVFLSVSINPITSISGRQ